MKQILNIVAGVIFGSIAVFCCFAFRAMNRLAEESRVPQLYCPVVEAICGYCDATRSAPERLEKLMPDYLNALPSGRPYDSVAYARMADGTNWMLCVTVDLRTRKDCWTYVYGSVPELEPPGSMTRIGRIHAWCIYKESEQAQQGGDSHASERR